MLDQEKAKYYFNYKGAKRRRGLKGRRCLFVVDICIKESKRKQVKKGKGRPSVWGSWGKRKGKHICLEVKPY